MQCYQFFDARGVLSVVPMQNHCSFCNNHLYRRTMILTICSHSYACTLPALIVLTTSSWLLFIAVRALTMKRKLSHSIWFAFRLPYDFFPLSKAVIILWEMSYPSKSYMPIKAADIFLKEEKKVWAVGKQWFSSNQFLWHGDLLSKKYFIFLIAKKKQPGNHW